MAVNTELSHDEVAAFFHALGLEQPNSVRGSTSGIEHTNYFVDTEKGEYVLTRAAHRRAIALLPPFHEAPCSARNAGSGSGCQRRWGNSSRAERPSHGHCQQTSWQVRDSTDRVALSERYWRKCTWQEATTRGARLIRVVLHGGMRWCRWLTVSSRANSIRCSRAS